MLYLNQRDYPDMPYPNNADNGYTPKENQNIAKSGCGICSCCMVVDQLTARSLSLEECVELSVASKANVRPGTNMWDLGPAVAEKFDLEYSETSDKAEMLAHLRKGGRAIVNVAEKPDGTPGLFTRAGHYMVLLSADGERVCFFDPNYTADAYGKGELKEKVDSGKAPFLYCDADLLQQETEARRIRYYLFARK